MNNPQMSEYISSDMHVYIIYLMKKTYICTPQAVPREGRNPYVDWGKIYIQFYP